MTVNAWQHFLYHWGTFLYLEYQNNQIDLANNISSFMYYSLSAMVPENRRCMSGLWDVTVRKRFNLIRKYYAFADISCRRNRMRSLQESLRQRKDNIFCESSCGLIPPTLNICSAAPKKPFLKPDPQPLIFICNNKRFISLLKASIQIFPLMIDQNPGPQLHIWERCDVISNVGWNGWANFWS